jgi:hypothetical protein
MAIASLETVPVQYNRVPAATVDFWLIKLMAVTMGACCVIDDLPDIYGRDGVLTRLIAVETADLV